MSRYIRHFRQIAPLVLFLAGLTPLRAADAVEELRQALRTTFPPTANEKELKYQLQYRRDLLEKRIKALGVGDLRRALTLQEWRDQDRDLDIRDLDRSLRDQVVDRLRQLLQELLRSDEPTVRLAALAQVRELGVNVRGSGDAPLAQSLAPDLVQLFAAPDPPSRAAAAQAFGFIDPDPRLVPALGKLLHDGDAGVRQASAEALAELVRTIQPLMKSRGATGIEISRPHAAVLGAVTIDSARQGLSLDPPAVRDACLEAIHLAAILLRELVLEPTRQDFPPPDRLPTQDERDEIAHYRQSVEDERTDVMPLARALGEATPAVVARLQSARDRNRNLAIRTLADIGIARIRLVRKAQSVPRPPPAKKGEVALPGNHHLLVNFQAADPLDDDPLRPGLVAAIPALCDSLSDSDVTVRRLAVNILESLSREAEIIHAVPAITRALADRDLFVRWSAARLIGRIGPVDAAATVPALARLLTDGDLDVQMAAATALGRLGPEAAAAVPVLASQVSRGDPENRVRMVQALQAIHVASADVINALAAGLGNEDPRVREASANALRSFGPAAKAAIPQLEKILNDPDDGVRKAASDALLAVSAPK